MTRSGLGQHEAPSTAATSRATSASCEWGEQHLLPHRLPASQTLMVCILGGLGGPAAEDATQSAWAPLAGWAQRV